MPLVLGLNYLGGWWYAVAIGLVGLLTQFELLRLLRAAGYRPLRAVVLPATAMLVAVPAAVAQRDVPAVWVGVLVVAVMLAGAYFLLPRAYPGGLLNGALSVFALVYVGLLLAHLTLLRQFADGAWWVVLVLATTWAYDTGAYFAGRSLGTHRFMAHVSPSKTVEGVLGGLALAALVALVAVPTLRLAVWQALLFGLAAGAIGQAGDLVESMIKRQTGAKDSGALIPGHGGLLDRIDSLLFTGVLGYYAAVLLGHGT